MWFNVAQAILLAAPEQPSLAASIGAVAPPPAHGPVSTLYGNRLLGFSSVQARVYHGSLLTCRAPHNMDRLLHRGKNAVEPEAANEPVITKPVRGPYHIYNMSISTSISPQAGGVARLSSIRNRHVISVEPD